MSSSTDSSCYTVVFDSSSETLSAADLRKSLEKGSDEVKIDTLRRIVISTMNGNPHVRVFDQTAQYMRSIYILANAYDAYHPIRYAFTEQTAQEAAALLLGSMSQIRRAWEAEAGDDSCRVRPLSIAA